MRSEPHSTGCEGISLEKAFTLVFCVVSGYSACFWPFTRRYFGSKALALNGLLAMGVMYLYAGFAPCPEMVYFFAAWFFMVLCHRYTTLMRRWHGRITHSRDHGEPWVVAGLLRLKPHQEFAAKTFGEPLLLVVAGTLLAYQVPMLGRFFIGGAVAQFLKQLIERGMDDAEIQAMRDNEIDMRNRMARYRGHS